MEGRGRVQKRGGPIPRKAMAKQEGPCCSHRSIVMSHGRQPQPDRSRGVAVRAHELHGVAADGGHWTTATIFAFPLLGRDEWAAGKVAVLAMAGTLGRRVGRGSGATGGASGGCVPKRRGRTRADSTEGRP